MIVDGRANLADTCIAFQRFSLHIYGLPSRLTMFQRFSMVFKSGQQAGQNIKASSLNPNEERKFSVLSAVYGRGVIVYKINVAKQRQRIDIHPVS